MSKKKESKTAVWRDTNKYPFAPQYNYPLSIRNRCLFFWASTLKSWKAIMNLADRLTEPNRLCVVYLFGAGNQEIISRHIQKINNSKVIVLWADYIGTDEIETVMIGAEKIRIAVMNWGLGKKSEFDDRNPYSEEAIEERMKKVQAAPVIEIPNGRKALWQIKERIAQNGYKNLAEDMRNVRPDENGHIQDLFRIIRQIYPSGAEVDTKEDYAYKILHFEKWCDSGISRQTNRLEKLGVYYEDNSEPVQLSLFDMTSWGIVEFVNEFRNLCDKEIQKNGFSDLGMVLQAMKSPPYGMYQCNYYGLCIGIALQKYVNGYYISGNLLTRKSEDFDFPKTIKYLFDSDGRNRSKAFYIYTQSESQIILAENIRKIFESRSRIEPLCLENVLTGARSWFEENVMYDTVQRTIPELFEILSLWEPEVCSNTTEKYATWLTKEMVEKVKRDIRNIDSNFLQMLSDKYGSEMSSLYEKSQGMKGGAVGWLHDVEMVDERVENYMKKETVCRECGAIIHNVYDVCENGISGNHARITKQDVIGLNKKILGRHQNEYFCLKCLCEYLDTDEWSLHQKILDFKEQGCTLFG